MNSEQLIAREWLLSPVRWNAVQRDLEIYRRIVLNQKYSDRTVVKPGGKRYQRTITVTSVGWDWNDALNIFEVTFHGEVTIDKKTVKVKTSYTVWKPGNYLIEPFRLPYTWYYKDQRK